MGGQAHNIVADSCELSISFRFYSTRNEKKGCTALAHRSDFCIDEKGMKAAIYAFAEYIMGAEPSPDIYLG